MFFMHLACNRALMTLCNYATYHLDLAFDSITLGEQNGHSRSRLLYLWINHLMQEVPLVINFQA
jgi:hypothetical protein